ncbi:formate dehydrogenase [Pseudofrankia inefficax]|uniref:Putative formate dehydrogenase n=1 Tax=Pseudofrankia inefficax (strain DSM 45817 / CECT 9037 / DDB 130130 / EuI1c) TaxID=298654 RepID=E3JDM4_PSEI1|nr:formate dehydrogenase [Pseudofrankia inefficax]ADP84790.1 putative formate dehydrogenase [Pseudofrankia inefficax]
MSIGEYLRNPPASRGGDIRRFGPATRWVHRTTGLLFGVCLATAAILYLPALALLFGRRPLIMSIHLYCGLALPVPALLGWLTRGFRRDTTELNRFTAPDGAWLRARLLPFSEERRARQAGPAWARSGTPSSTARRGAGGHDQGPLTVGGKFNAGQKLYAAVVAGSILVFLGTGLVMYLGQDLHIPDRYRTGASFVHDLLAFGIFFTVCGHLWMASRDPVARAGMRTGYVPRWWARTEHPHWAALAPEDLDDDVPLASNGADQDSTALP